MTVQHCMCSFIVRIYGRAGTGDGAFVGVVQEIEGGRSVPFRGADELWSIVTSDRLLPGPSDGSASDGAAPEEG